jgi:hypothetical protein
MIDHYSHAREDENNRLMDRVATLHRLYPAPAPFRSECIWWMGYLGYMETLPGFDSNAWFSAIEGWLTRLGAIGASFDGAYEELERMRGAIA